MAELFLNMPLMTIREIPMLASAPPSIPELPSKVLLTMDTPLLGLARWR
jgi:hypothetical protein